MESIFGLPAHPLFVHAPVVLMPLLAIATVALAIRPRWRLRFGPALAVSALGIAVLTILAAASGEPFVELVSIGTGADKHKSLGETTRLLTVLFFLASAATAGFDWRTRGSSKTSGDAGQSSMVGVGLIALTTLLAIAATIWMIRTGHEGARITWTGLLPENG